MAVQRMEFWPKAAVSAYLPDSAPTYFVYTKVFPTTDFTEVVAQLECHADIGQVDARIVVTPQIGNNGGSWEDLTAFTAITEGGTFPYNESQKISTVGESMRFKIALDLSAGNKPMLVVGTIAITAVGRSED